MRYHAGKPVSVSVSVSLSLCVRACVRACARAFVRGCVCVCVCVCVDLCCQEVMSVAVLQGAEGPSLGTSANEDCQRQGV